MKIKMYKCLYVGMFMKNRPIGAAVQFEVLGKRAHTRCGLECTHIRGINNGVLWPCTVVDMMHQQSKRIYCGLKLD
jgi:hypothetical protein